jgi:hypothetical protein
MCFQRLPDLFTGNPAFIGPSSSPKRQRVLRPTEIVE